MKQPLAYVHPEAQIADNVVIEPFVTIDKNVARMHYCPLEHPHRSGKPGGIFPDLIHK